jgi:multiple sugar transport system ATP-binding protein
VYDDPADQFVAGFLGSPPMNLLTGTVAGDGEELRLDLGGQSLPIPGELRSFQGKRLKLGIRPEAIAVDASAVGLRCALEVFEPLGSSTLLTFALCGQVLKVQAPASFRAEPGEDLRLTLPAEQCRWYDPETQLLLETR